MKKLFLLCLPTLLLFAACRRDQPQKPVDDPGDTVPRSIFEPDTTLKQTADDSIAIDTAINILDEEQVKARKKKASPRPSPKDEEVQNEPSGNSEGE